VVPDKEFVFAGHAAQAADPPEFVYFPIAHAVHSEPESPVHPVLQTQAVILMLSTGEFEFGVQFPHTVDSGFDLY